MTIFQVGSSSLSINPTVALMTPPPIRTTSTSLIGTSPPMHPQQRESPALVFFFGAVPCRIESPLCLPSS